MTFFKGAKKSIILSTDFALHPSYFKENVMYINSFFRSHFLNRYGEYYTD